MNKRDSELLDKILQILTANFRDPYFPKQFYQEKEILNVYSDAEVDNVLNTYGREYYDIVNLGEFIRIKPKYKDIIETYGSLSSFLKMQDKSKRRVRRFDVAKFIIPIIISVSMLISSIIFGIMNVKLNHKVDKLEKQIIEKDSIIRQFNDKIYKSDSLIIK